MTTKEFPPLTLNFTKVKDGLPDKGIDEFGYSSNFCLCMFLSKDGKFGFGPASYVTGSPTDDDNNFWQFSYEPQDPIDDGVVVAWTYYPGVPQAWIDQLKREEETAKT